MNKLIFICLIAVAVVMSLGGCSTGTLSRYYGYAYTTTRDGEILNPQASKNLGPVQGLDGRAALETLGKYQDSFGGEAAKKKTGPTQYSITPVNQ